MLPLVAVLVLGVYAQQTFADEPEAIVGGSLASPGELPYQCSLRYRGSHICGCTIVSSTCIVTAAHCLQGIVPPPYTSIQVVTGHMSSSGGQTRTVKLGRIHPSYAGTSQQSWSNDAAVLVLSQPISFSSYQSSIGLANYAPSAGTRCLVSGWGKTSTNSQVSQALRKASTVIVDTRTCQSHHRGQPISNAHLCTSAGHGIGACQGDSGGPLVCNGQLAGIVSWVMPCAVGYPDVFCNVAAVLPFIRSVCPGV